MPPGAPYLSDYSSTAVYAGRGHVFVLRARIVGWPNCAVSVLANVNLKASLRYRLPKQKNMRDAEGMLASI